MAQTESNFDMDAVGASGEVGIMQLNPGPGSSYHAEIQAATGLDPTTASGNIAGGCYKLGLYLAKYGSVEKAAMAYNMGEGGARNAWDSGITSTDYSKAVKEAMETWECTVNAWGGV
ncbi:MAG: C-type lysozyme/alpha-lactalbumin family protein [Bacteriophage sp.]|nr:MAG: C-type lysozyme/alpha-lactalbumin family protein [Bacteriophage sp.]